MLCNLFCCYKMEEGKIDSSSAEDLKNFLELFQEEIAISNQSLYKELYLNCKLQLSFLELLYFYCFLDQHPNGRMSIYEIRQLTRDALEACQNFVPHMFSGVVQQATVAAAQTLQHMSENYGSIPHSVLVFDCTFFVDREISSQDIDQITSKLQDTLDNSIVKLQT